MYFPFNMKDLIMLISTSSVYGNQIERVISISAYLTIKSGPPKGTLTLVMGCTHRLHFSGQALWEGTLTLYKHFHMNPCSLSPRYSEKQVSWVLSGFYMFCVCFSSVSVWEPLTAWTRTERPRFLSYSNVISANKSHVSPIRHGAIYPTPALPAGEKSSGHAGASKLIKLHLKNLHPFVFAGFPLLQRRLWRCQNI